MRIRAVTMAITLAVIAGCTGRRAEKAAPKGAVRITVLGINDFHGAIEERRVMVKTSGGTAELRTGGAPLLASYVQKLREANPEGTLLLSGGDMWQGSMESNFFEGRPVVLLDNAMGVDATAVGNHEFDYGPSGPVSLGDPRDPPAVRYGALLERQQEATFPFLAANVRSTEKDAPSFRPWVIVRRKGLQIAIIGLATEDTPNTTQRANIVGLAFDPPAPALVNAAAEARKAGADIVVVTAHLGGTCKRGTAPEDEDACAADEEVMRVLRAIPAKTVDAFVAGHTHAVMAHVINGIPVIESGAYGQAIGRIDLDYDPVARKVAGSKIFPTQPICRDVLVATGSCAPPLAGEALAARADIAPATFRGGTISPDPAIERMLAPFRQEVAELKAETLATADRAMGVARGEASEMGALVTDEMRAATKRLADVPDADFAMQNSGGIRAPLPKGPISYGALYEVLPFDNYLATISLTGEQLEALFTGVYKTGRVVQTSGLRAEYCGQGEKAKVRLFDFASGKPLLSKKTYVLVWNDFLAGGGDGTKDALPASVVSAVHGKYLMRDVVADGLRARAGKHLNPDSDPILDPKKPRVAHCKEPR